MSDKIEWESYSAPQKEGDVWIVEINALENTGPKSARVFKSEQEAKAWIRQQVLSPLNK